MLIACSLCSWTKTFRAVVSSGSPWSRFLWALSFDVLVLRLQVTLQKHRTPQGCFRFQFSMQFPIHFPTFQTWGRAGETSASTVSRLPSIGHAFVARMLIACSLCSWTKTLRVVVSSGCAWCRFLWALSFEATHTLQIPLVATMEDSPFWHDFPWYVHTCWCFECKSFYKSTGHLRAVLGSSSLCRFKH